MEKNRGSKLFLLFSTITLFASTALAYSITGQQGFMGAVFGEFMNFQNQWELLANAGAFFLIWMFGYIVQALIIQLGTEKMPDNWDGGDKIKEMLLGDSSNSYGGAEKRNLLIWITLLEVLTLGRLLPALISDARSLILTGAGTLLLMVVLGFFLILILMGGWGALLGGGAARNLGSSVKNSPTGQTLKNAAERGGNYAKNKWDSIKNELSKNKHVQDAADDFAKTINNNASTIGWIYCPTCAADPNEEGLQTPTGSSTCNNGHNIPT